MAPGQISTIVFQNPDLDSARSVSNCKPQRLIGWTKSEIPILRFEQNGKQIWMSFGSYSSIGDSCIGSFIAPESLEPGTVALSVVDGHDASVPSTIVIVGEILPRIMQVQGGGIHPLQEFRVIGDGFWTPNVIDRRPYITELSQNIGYDKMPSADQWVALNHRILKDWDILPDGDYLTIDQEGKSWKTFVDDCGIEPGGLTLDFSAPPDLKAGTASITLSIRKQDKEIAKTQPLSVTVQ